MSLKGSLQTVPLPEVLQFLSDTGKSGELHVCGAHGEGRLWFDTGRMAAFDAGPSREPFEAVYELLRVGEGDFDFVADHDAPDGAVRAGEENMAEVIRAAQARLAEWHEIVEVVPSVHHQLRLVPEAPEEGVLLEPAQWSMIVAVGDGRSVGEVLERAGQREFEGCRAVRDVVRANLLSVHAPLEAPEPAPGGEAAADEAPERGGAALVGGEVTAGSAPVAGDEEQSAPAWGADDWSEPSAASWADAEAPEDGRTLSGSLLRFGVDAAPAYPDVDEATEISDWDEAGPLERSLEDAGAEVEGADDTVAAEQVDDPEVVAEGGGAGDEAAATSFEAVAESAESAEDRYAALRAAVMEVEELAADDDDYSGQPASVYQLGVDEHIDGRAALQALLSEVTTPDSYDPTGEPEAGYDGGPGGGWESDPAPMAGSYAGADSEAVDGLADRGPWTDHELAVMDADSWSEPLDEASNILPFPPAAPAATAEAAPTTVAAEGEDAPEPDAVPAEEPVNRGLLLKFLSSVRN